MFLGIFNAKADAATNVTTTGYHWDGSEYETINWSVSGNVELLTPWGNHCQTYDDDGIWPQIMCTYEANFTPAIGGVTSVQARITPRDRWHEDSFTIDYGKSDSMDVCAPTGLCRPCDPSTGLYCDYLPPYTYNITHTANLWSWCFDSYSKGYGFKIRYYRYRLPIYNQGITRKWFTMEIHVKPSDAQLSIFRKFEGAGPPRLNDWGFPFDGTAGWQPPAPSRQRVPSAFEPDSEFPWQEAGGGPGACGMGLPDYWINTANLNVAVKDTVLAYESLGPDISMTHYYNAIPGIEGMFGKGWTFEYESQLTASSLGGAYLKLGTGRTITYASPFNSWGGVIINPPFDYLPPAGVGDTLTDYNGYCIWHSATSDWDYRYEKLSGEAYRLSSISDRNGNTLRLTYNANGRITEIADAAGRVSSFSYNTQGLCSSMRAPDGRMAYYGYDGSGRLITSTDMAGILTTYTYDSEDYLTTMTVGDKKTAFTWETNERFGKYLRTVTDAEGKVQRFGIENPGDDDHLMYSRTNDLGEKTTYKSLMNHPFTTDVANDSGETSTVGFSIQSEHISSITHTNPDGDKTRVIYDTGPRSKTKIKEYVDPLGNSTRYTYSDNGNMLTQKGPDESTWRYSYDSKGNLIQKTSPSGKVIHYTRDAKGQLTALEDPSGNITRYTYDQWGNITSITDPEGNTRNFSYQDTYGLYLAGYTDAQGNTTRLERDKNQRITAVLNPDGSRRTTVYDCCSPVSVTNEIGQTSAVSRNKLLMPKKETTPAGGSLSYDYNAKGLLYGLTFADGSKTYAFYGDDNLISGIQDAAGNSLTIERDDAGRITKLTDQIGVSMTYGYDAASRVTQITDALNQTRRFTRDVMCRITEIKTARGGTVGFVFDSDGRCTAQFLDGVKAAEYGYAANGKLTSVSDAWGTTGYIRDKNGRVKTITYPDGRTLSYSYDGNGSPLSITYPGGLVVTYRYDVRNRPTSALWGTESISFGYDAAGNLLTETRSNGTSSAYTYDANGRMTKISYKKGAATLASLSFARDVSGRISKQSTVLPQNPLLPAQGAQSTYNGAGQLATSGGANWIYDADGNAKTVTGRMTGSFTHDSLNRLTAMTWGGVNTSFLFDGLNNRVRITKSGKTIYLHYDTNGRLMFETDGANNLVVCYVYTGGRLLAQYKPGDGSYFHHFDQNGSTLVMTDKAGAVQRTYAYLPFGAAAVQSGNLENRFNYVGAWGVTDDGNGLFFMRNRMYDAGTRRFLERDPIGWSGGSNIYAYVSGNPINQVDPNGFSAYDFTMWNDQYWYDTNTAEGTWDLDWGIEPHMADPVSEGEMLLMGAAAVVSTAVIGGAAFLSSLYTAPYVASAGVPVLDKVISPEGQAYMDRLTQAFQGNLPGVDPRSSIAFDWLVNMNIPAGDKTRIFTGACKYIWK